MGLELDPLFVDQLSDRLGNDLSAFLNALEQPSPVSIRLNRLKNARSIPSHIGNVPWNAYGFYLEQRPSFTYDPLFHAGVYYVQEASSMLVGEITRLIQQSDWELVIDLCAAPGGKTTDILNQVSPSTVVLANEVVTTRVGALRQNLIKWGHPNTIVSSYPTKQLAMIAPQADMVVVDAPCSGEGMFRKEPQAVAHWNLNNQQVCVHRQREILQDAVDMIKPGGYLLYSTCTYNSDENEGQIDYIIQQHHFEPVDFHVDDRWQLKKVEGQIGYGYQCYPHLVQGEGFFVALLKKPDRTIRKFEIPSKPKSSQFTQLTDKELKAMPNFIDFEAHNLLKDTAGNLWLGDTFKHFFDIQRFKPLFELGAVKGKEFVPAHSLSMLKRFENNYPRIDLSHDQAIRYLKKETLDNTHQFSNGWYYVCFEDAVLGLVKVVGSIMKNHFPINWRILK